MSSVVLFFFLAAIVSNKTCKKGKMFLSANVEIISYFEYQFPIFITHLLFGANESRH